MIIHKCRVVKRAQKRTVPVSVTTAKAAVKHSPIAARHDGLVHQLHCITRTPFGHILYMVCQACMIVSSPS
jgi:hypothetical protein